VAEDEIRVEADTTLPDGTRVTIELLQDDEPLEWFSSADETAQVSGGAIEVTLNRDPDGPMADPDQEQEVVLTAELRGETITDSEELFVISRLAEAFYMQATPTPSPSPTPSPTTAAAEPVEAEPTPVPEPEPEPEPAPQGITVAVGNGGNVRAQPSADAPVVGQVALGDEVQVFEKTADSVWYSISFNQGTTGWAHRVVLQLDGGVAAQVPVQGQEAAPAPDTAGEATGLSTTVFNGGNVREQPSLNGVVVGGVNAGESVELLAKTGDGVWYQIRNTRGVVGWTHNSLLTLPQNLIDQVPVA
jgi:SH3-like domain-containing protein